MALVDLTKQLAQQALLSATQDTPPAPPPPDNSGAVILGQVDALQKLLKDDEELVIHVHLGGEKIRVMELFLPSAQVLVLTGIDANRVMTRVVSAVGTLQLLIRTGKVQPGAKPVRIRLGMPKSKDGAK